MKRIEVQFLDTYKELDKICGSLFNVKNGVSEYIATMEKCANAGNDKIKDWQKNYKLLKHLRWIRNKIAHEEESPCTKEDLQDLKYFIKLVKTEKDPISLLYFSKNDKALKARKLYRFTAGCFYLASFVEYITALYYFMSDNSSSGVTWLCLGSAMLCVGSVQLLYSKRKK